MKTRNMIYCGALGVGLLASGILIAQGPPAENIDPSRHPHLSAAQHHLRMAFDEASEAQHANDWDMDGHAARAKELMTQAAHELKESAESANHHR